MWNEAQWRIWGSFTSRGEQLESACRLWAAAATFLLQTRSISDLWPGLRIGLALVLQRPLSTWKTIFPFNVDIKVPEPWRTSGDAQEPELRPEDQRGKWWLVSWNSWFHFPAGLGNCPHCSTWCKDRAIPALHWLANLLKNPQRIFGLLWKREMRDTRIHNAEEPKVTMGATWTSCSRLDPSGPSS